MMGGVNQHGRLRATPTPTSAASRPPPAPTPAAARTPAAAGAKRKYERKVGSSVHLFFFHCSLIEYPAHSWRPIIHSFVYMSIQSAGLHPRYMNEGRTFRQCTGYSMIKHRQREMKRIVRGLSILTSEGGSYVNGV